MGLVSGGCAVEGGLETETSPGMTPVEMAVRAVAAAGARRRGAGEEGTRFRLVLGTDAAPGPVRPFIVAARRALREAGVPEPFAVAVERSVSIAESRVGVEAYRPGMRLQQRDREILATIGTARYLTTAQLVSLFFPDAHFTVPLRRLRSLAAGGFVRGDEFVNARRGHVRGWTLTAAGFVGAQDLIRLPPYPTEPVRPQFLEHMTWLNELFVALVSAGGVPLRRATFPFRWVPDTGRWYAIRPRFDIGGKPRCVVPDAIVEFHGSQRRVFIEAERGTHTIVPVSTAKTGATIVKLDRYTGFFRDRTEFRSDATSYTTEFGDTLSPELVFLVHTDGRKGRVEKAIAEYDAKHGGPSTFEVHVWTMAEAKARCLGYLRERREPAPVPARGHPTSPVPARRVTVDGDQVRLLRQAFRHLRQGLAAASAGRSHAFTREEVDEVNRAIALLQDMKAAIAPATSALAPSSSSRR
jgi:hypothetical protein